MNWCKIQWSHEERTILLMYVFSCNSLKVLSGKKVYHKSKENVSHLVWSFFSCYNYNRTTIIARDLLLIDGVFIISLSYVHPSSMHVIFELVYIHLLRGMRRIEPSPGRPSLVRMLISVSLSYAYFYFSGHFYIVFAITYSNISSSNLSESNISWQKNKYTWKTGCFYTQKCKHVT